MSEDKSKKRRKRRSGDEIEKVCFASAEELIENLGFSNVTLTKIIQHANIEPCVFYNRYNDLEDFIDKFVRKYDYWIDESISVDPKKDPTTNYKTLMSDLIDSFWTNKIMQKLIAWELNEINYITLRTSRNRDANSQHLIQYFAKTLEGNSVNFGVATAILIGGLYYLVMHKEMATFNNIDFNSENGLNLIKENMLKMVDKIFGMDKTTTELEKEKIIEERCNIAKILLSNNVDRNIIKKATKLSDKELKVLSSQLLKTQ